MEDNKFILKNKNYKMNYVVLLQLLCCAFAIPSVVEYFTLIFLAIYDNELPRECAVFQILLCICSTALLAFFAWIKIKQLKWLTKGYDELFIQEDTMLLHRENWLTNRDFCIKLKEIISVEYVNDDFNVFLASISIIFRILNYSKSYFLKGGKIRIKYGKFQNEYGTPEKEFYFCHDTDEKARECVQALNEILGHQNIITTVSE